MYCLRGEERCKCEDITEINMKIKEDYEKLREKYDLPAYEYINYEFEISSIDIEKVSNLARGVLRAMINKMALFLNYLEPVISPNPQGLHAFIEVQNTNNDEKKEVFDFYKEVSKRYHRAYSKELIEDEETVVQEIKDVLKDWKKTKAQFKKLSIIVNKSWERETEKERVETIG